MAMKAPRRKAEEGSRAERKIAEEFEARDRKRLAESQKGMSPLEIQIRDIKNMLKSTPAGTSTALFLAQELSGYERDLAREKLGLPQAEPEKPNYALLLKRGGKQRGVAPL
jgi:hypothetical protein